MSAIVQLRLRQARGSATVAERVNSHLSNHKAAVKAAAKKKTAAPVLTMSVFIGAIAALCEVFGVVADTTDYFTLIGGPIFLNLIEESASFIALGQHAKKAVRDLVKQLKKLDALNDEEKDRLVEEYAAFVADVNEERVMQWRPVISVPGPLRRFTPVLYTAGDGIPPRPAVVMVDAPRPRTSLLGAEVPPVRVQFEDGEQEMAEVVPGNLEVELYHLSDYAWMRGNAGLRAPNVDLRDTVQFFDDNDNECFGVITARTALVQVPGPQYGAMFAQTYEVTVKQLCPELGAGEDELVLDCGYGHENVKVAFWELGPGEALALRDKMFAAQTGPHATRVSRFVRAVADQTLRAGLAGHGGAFGGLVAANLVHKFHDAPARQPPAPSVQ